MLHPSEGHKPGKTGIYDMSVVMDTFRCPEACWSVLRERAFPASRVWWFRRGSLAAQFQVAARRLKVLHLGLSPRSLKHGGAWEDLIAGRRIAQDVKLRGGWVSDSSLKRYGKAGRALTELHRLRPDVIEYGRTVASSLDDIVLRGAVIPAPPPMQS